MKPLFNLISILVLTLIFFIIWMNITPGHFQLTCYCNQVQYVTSEEIETVNQMCATAEYQCPSDNQLHQLQNSLLTTTASLDWNKQ